MKQLPYGTNGSITGGRPWPLGPRRFPSLSRQCCSNLKGADGSLAERRALRCSRECSGDLAFHANEFVSLVLKIHNGQGNKSDTRAAASLRGGRVEQVGTFKLLTGVLFVRSAEMSVGMDRSYQKLAPVRDTRPNGESVCTSVACFEPPHTPSPSSRSSGSPPGWRTGAPPHTHPSPGDGVPTSAGFFPNCGVRNGGI